MTTYGVDIYRRLAERLYGEDFPAWPTGIATGGGATTLVDTVNLAYTSGDANAFDGKYVLDETGYGFSRVTRGLWAPASSQLTFIDIQTDFAAGDRYVISDHHPFYLRAVINSLLRNLYVPCFFPLSLHICTNDDNDMEKAPATTFDGNKSDATLANESTIVYSGGQSLAVTASATGGYTHFGNVGVNDGESLYAAAMCYVTSGDSATFRLIDVTNTNATIEDATTDEVKWMELVYPFTVPSGCEQIHARIIADALTDVVYVDDYQIWHNGPGLYPAPSWLKYGLQIKDIRAFPHGTGGPSSDNDYRTNERRSQSLNWHPEREDMRADSPLHLWVEGTGGARPYIFAKRPLSEIVDFSTAGKTESGTSEAGSTTTLQDTGKTWIAGQWEGFTITCTSGTGGGQRATILTNDVNTVTIDTTWTAPSNDTVYSIAGNRSTPVYPVDTIVEHALFVIKHPDQAEKYLASLRQYQLGGAVSQFSERVGV